MASLLPMIPARFLDPSQKYPLVVYLVVLGVPARIARQVLQDWGAALGVEIAATDYELIDNHLAPRPVTR